jgi:hypothetical protein
MLGFMIIDVAASDWLDELLPAKLEEVKARRRECQTPENRAAAHRAF